MNKTVKVALVDDHVVLRNSLAGLLDSLGYAVPFQCSNGVELQNTINPSNLPDIILMDINMPQMDGFKATFWLYEKYPEVRVLALSMYDDETAIIRMIKNGAKGYVLKDVETMELKMAIENVAHKGFHYSETITGKLINSIHKGEKGKNGKDVQLNERETEFLKWAGTELTYKEIAQQMLLSPRTIDGYRDDLFEKLNVKSRVGLVLYAIKKGIIRVDLYN